MENIKFIIRNKIDVKFNEEIYSSDIQDVTEEYISISIPVRNGSYIPLHIGESIEAIYYCDDQAYKFISNIIGRKVDGIPQIILEYPTNIVSYQRRGFFRIQLAEQIKFNKYNKNNKNLELNKKGIMVDISGSGMKLITNEKFLSGDILEMEISINKESFIVTGEIVRISKNEVGYIYGINFTNEIPYQCEKIVKNIFSIVRNKIKRV